MPVFCLVDDKHIPLYRIMWISALPHYCGTPECEREGQYEVRLEQEETVWASQKERDDALAALEAWANGERADGCEDEHEEEGEG